MMDAPPCPDVVYEPYKKAITEIQKKSIAELPIGKRYALYESVTPDNLMNYHRISCKPITVKAENDMELVSDLLGWGERYLHHWQKGIYYCSRCLMPLYKSSEKYNGPCVWPSFRREISTRHQQGGATTLRANTSTATVSGYNSYPESVTVKEVYCSGCDLFIGHQFDDARAKGDMHEDALWRH